MCSPTKVSGVLTLVGELRRFRNEINSAIEMRSLYKINNNKIIKTLPDFFFFFFLKYLVDYLTGEGSLKVFR